MEIIITAVVAFVAGWYLSKIAQAFITAELLKELGITVDQLENLKTNLSKEESEEPTLTEVEVKIEKHNDQLYAFRVDNDQFLGQGQTRELLIDRIAETLNNVKLVIKEENGAGHIRNNVK